MEQALIAFFLTGLGLGMLHAFDPDHVAAVAGLSATDQKKTQVKAWRYALHWSFGHCGVLLLIGCGVLLFGLALPSNLSQMAEKSVAVILIVIGAMGYWRLLPSNNSAGPEAPSRNRRYFGAHFVGMVHGTAGSAPLLSILPITSLESPYVGIVYILLFGAGVSIAMTSLGGLYFHGAQQLKKWHGRAQTLLHVSLASFSFLLGCFFASVSLSRFYRACRYLVVRRVPFWCGIVLV